MYDNHVVYFPAVCDSLKRFCEVLH